MEEGGGIIALAVMVLMLPFMIVADLFRLFDRARQRRRNLVPAEQALRLASQPVGALAVTIAAAWLFPELGAALSAVLHQPADDWLPAVLLVALLAFALVAAGVGIKDAAGMRDWLRALRALFKLGGGVFVAVKLWPLASWAGYGRDWWAVDLLRLALLVGVWLAATGLVRLLLLTVGGGSALALVREILERRNGAMRPGRF